MVPEIQIRLTINYLLFPIMKKARVILFALMLSLALNSGFAQGKWGKDSTQCLMALNNLKQYHESKSFTEAYPELLAALKYCPPKSSVNMYIYGQSVYKFLAEKATNPERKKALTDSLALMYDSRANYFPKYAIKAQTYKTYDLVSLGADDEIVYKELLKTVNLAGENTESAILVLAIHKAKDLMDKGKLTADAIMDLYTKGLPILEAQTKSADAEIKQAAETAKKDFESLFAVSGVASCENLVKLFTPKFDANPNDKDLVTKIVALLNNGGCVKEDLFLRSVESLNKIEPSYLTAYYLYRLYASKDDNATAIKYLQEAIESQGSNDLQDADYMMELATFYFHKFKNNAKAIEYAKQAVSRNSALAGKAYMLIGSIWATNKCGGNEVEQRAHFWVAVDYFNKAKNADATLAEDADKFISTYRQYFPAQEEAFMYDIMDGSSYTVACGGLRETTIVKTRK